MAAVAISTSPERPAPVVNSEHLANGVAVVTIDDTRARFNTIGPILAAELGAALDMLEADATVKAIVVRSGKRDSFLAGANLEVVRSLRFAKDAEDAALEVAKRFARIESSEKPVVACVHGLALGGGFELALACAATVASDDPKTMLGLPEVKLGLMPAANGLLRVADRAGLRVALDLGLTGRKLRAREALALGLIDEIVAPEVALDAACNLALRLSTRPELRKLLPRKRRVTRAKAKGAHGAKANASLTDRIERVLLDQTPFGRALVFRRARAASRHRTRGHYPATGRILDTLERYAHRGFRSAAKLEARLFGELVVSETSHRLVELFFAQTALKKEMTPKGDDVSTLERVAVVGAGLMGAGIATITVEAGLPVRMKDTDDAHLGRGLRYVRDAIQARVSRGAISGIERDRIFQRLEATVEDSGFRHVDVVVEAVFEDLALKQEILRSIERLVADDCVIASNTSSLPITKIAEVAEHPERVVGMHYFRPATRVPLVEIVRTKFTSARTLRMAIELGRRQGKTVVVVDDGAGFYTTRIISPLLAEAARLVSEGGAIEAIDEALVDWGFPAGPLQLFDELGIDLATRVADVMHGAFGERMDPPEALIALARDDRKGRKNGRGFYLYDAGYGRVRSAIRRVDDTVYETLQAMPRSKMVPEEIQLRCTLAMVNEALRCLEEGVLRSARDGDVAAVLGLGFPAFRGGPFRYVDALGASEVLRRMRSLEQRFGTRFTPASLLVEMARHGKRTYG